MQRIFTSIFGIGLLSIGAAGLVELTIIKQPQSWLYSSPEVSQSTKITPAPLTPSSTPIATTPSPTSTSVITPTPRVVITPSNTPIPGVVSTNSFVRLRALPSTSSAVLAEITAGTVVTLGSYQDNLWQGVVVNGQPGYIYRSYLAY